MSTARRFGIRGVLISVFFLTVSIALLVTGVQDIVFGLQSRHWPETTGTIHKILPGLKWAGATVFYGYWVDGKYYKGDNPGYGVTLNTRKAERRYAQGSRVSVYYDLAKPSRSTLKPGYHLWGFGQILGGLLMGGLTLWGIRLHFRKMTVSRRRKGEGGV